MIALSQTAQKHFKHLIDAQDIPGLGIRIRVQQPGTLQANCHIEFCESSDLTGDEWIVECADFNVYIDSVSQPFLESASIDFHANSTGGQLAVKAPHIKGQPKASEGLIARIQNILDEQINPQLAAHNGSVRLMAFEADGTAVLQFGGGCHGCGMVDVTLKEGIEKTLKTHIPEITKVVDITDHESGETPYYAS